jgi:Predicted phosphohydrolases
MVRLVRSLPVSGSSEVCMAAQYSRPSNFIVQSVGPIAEWAIDWIFLSSAAITPVTTAAAVYFGFTDAPWLAALCALVAVGAAWGIYARFIAPWQLRVKKLDLSAGKPGAAGASGAEGRPRLKVVFFSDLHLGQFKRQEWAQRVVEAVNAQSPDLVLIGGDFLGKTQCCEVAELLMPLRHLRATHGAYAVLGNHDYGIPGCDHSDELIQLLPQLNIRLLHNECVAIGEEALLVGVDELWAGRDNLPGALMRCHGCPPTTRMVVLGHNPDLMLKLESQRDHPGAEGRFLHLWPHPPGANLHSTAAGAGRPDQIQVLPRSAPHPPWRSVRLVGLWRA